jgi:hypothetical protein
VPDLGTLLPTVRSEEDLDFAERTVAHALRLLLVGRFGRTVGAEAGFGVYGEEHGDQAADAGR